MSKGNNVKKVTENKNPKNLPALLSDHNSFVMPAESSPIVKLSDELIAEINGNENDYYEDPPDRLPYVGIRQKPLMDNNGRTIEIAGGFKYENVEYHVPDISGDEGLLVSILIDKQSRVYFPSSKDKKPACKSNDLAFGLGSPGGDCRRCPLGLFNDKTNESPKCKQQYNLFCYDLSIENTQPTYILRIGTSGLKPYGVFKSFLKNSKVKTDTGIKTVPILYACVLITSKFVKGEKGDHYVPVFQLVDTHNIDMVRKLNKLQSEFGKVFKHTVVDVDVEQDNGEETTHINSDIPDGATDVRTQGEIDHPDSPDYR